MHRAPFRARRGPDDGQRVRLPHLLVLPLVAAGLLLPSTSAAAPTATVAKRVAPASCKKVLKTPTAKRTAAQRRTARRCARVQRHPSGWRPSAVRPATAPGAATAGTSVGVLQQALVACTNRARAAHGLPALAVDPALTRAAQAHAADMDARDYFDHTTPEGLEPWDRVRAALGGAAPFSAVGENIAMGYADADATCDGWMDSPGHRANILSEEFTLIGTGWVDGHAVQNFGARR